MAKKKAKKKPAKPKATINTAVEAISDYAIQLKGRAKDGEIRGVLTVEFGVDPKDGGIRQAGAVSSQEAALASLLIKQMVIGGFQKMESK